jgi:dienelactone hydrolase
MMHALLRWLLVGLVALSANAAAADRLIDGVPIPDDATVIGTESMNRFFGAWVGRWNGEFKHILIVESIANGKAKVVFASDDAPQLGLKRGWIRIEDAWISGDTLTVNGDGFSASYRKTAMGWSEASFSRGAVTGKADLPRLTFPELLAPDTTFGNAGESIMIDTGPRENGQTVRLQVVIFKPAGKGPFPLLVVNHGSTGKGTDPTSFQNVFADRAFAKVFVSKGYLVAYPQRRGRGNSDSFYDEGFYPDRALGYTCEPGRSLAGADRALADIEAAVAVLRGWPNVKKGRVLMAGVSRGGALSIAYAGMHPHDIDGAINFVGGWMSEACGLEAAQMTRFLVGRGGAFRRPTLWLYGIHDRFYSLGHSGENFAAFRAAGGQGTFVPLEAPPDINGHFVMFHPSLWTSDVDRYLGEIGALDGK